MNEYYCPKCGAILNDQDGFDPNCGTWVCTECGEQLMDDDIYNNDSFEGVAWYCDKCGALLNRQPGFSDSYGSWTCTECGHTNGTTEDDISEEQAEFTCPNCGVALDFQPGFSRYDDDWECTACGAHLHHTFSSDEYSVVEEPKHRCPSCGAGLDNQWGYDDYQDNWTCTECGAHLHHSYSGDDYTVMEHICPSCGAPLDIQWGYSKYDDDWECTECGAHLHREFSSDDYDEVQTDDDSSNYNIKGAPINDYYSYSYSSPSSPYNSPSSSKSTNSDTTKKNNTTKNNTTKNDTIKNNNNRSSKQSYTSQPSQNSANKAKIEPKKKINRKRYFIGAVLITIFLLVGSACYEISLLTSIGYSSTDLIGQNYEFVESVFADLGFADINITEIPDLPLERQSEENKVDYIKIGIAESFEKDSRYPSNFPVEITYHTLEKYAVPMSSKEAKGANYEDVVNSFKNAGFEKISLQVEYDIITGWLTDEGEVKSVTVNEDKKFAKGDEYRADAEVVITYHTYKKNKPK